MTDPQELARLSAEAGQTLLQPPEGDPDAEREYVRLFLSPQGALCPPWQSVWVREGDAPRLLGPPHHQALQWFRRYGFQPANESEPADHAGLLLVFYSYLLSQGVDSEVLARFEADHLEWMQNFAESLAGHATSERYRVLARVLSELARGGAG